MQQDHLSVCAKASFTGLEYRNSTDYQIWQIANGTIFDSSFLTRAARWSIWSRKTLKKCMRP